MRLIIASMMCLLLVAACGPTPVTEQVKQEVIAEPTVSPPAEPVATPPAAVVAEPEPSAPVMDADTESRLATNFKPGVRFVLSHKSDKVAIGQSKVYGVALRGLLPDEDSYMVSWRLVRSYDRSKSPITSDTPPVQGWIESNGVSAAENNFAPVVLSTNGEITYPFLVTVQKTFADGTPTKPGTYVFEFTVKTKGRASAHINAYAQTELTLLVE